MFLQQHVLVLPDPSSSCFSRTLWHQFIKVFLFIVLLQNIVAPTRQGVLAFDPSSSCFSRTLWHQLIKVFLLLDPSSSCFSRTLWHQLIKVFLLSAPLLTYEAPFLPALLPVMPILQLMTRAEVPPSSQSLVSEQPWSSVCDTKNKMVSEQLWCSQDIPAAVNLVKINNHVVRTLCAHAATRLFPV